MVKKRKVTIGATQVCSREFGVTSITSSGGNEACARHQPCPECPWRKDAPVGRFPAQAYRVSAPTAYDAAMRTFGCHMSGAKKPATCAGFLLRHGLHNLGVRLQLHGERIDLNKINDGGVALYANYRDCQWRRAR